MRDNRLGKKEGDKVGYFLIWVACGIAAAVVASSKNRSGTAWFFLGILLGPLALLMVGFMPSPQEAHSELGLKKCPYCAEEIQPEAIVCRFCSKDQPPSSPAAPEKTSAAQVEIVL